MFVQHNSLSAIREYYNRELSNLYSSSEIKLMIKLLTVNRFNISDSEFILFDEKLSESDLLYYHFALKRLRNNEPFQYILGSVEFCGFEMKTDKRALIPRPETEELVEWISGDLSPASEYQILDLCSGSGCIAFGLQKMLPKASLSAVELSSEACHLIEENKRLLGMNIELFTFDALQAENYAVLKKKFDVWVSNPPYIPEKDKKAMQRNVLDHEPAMALFVNDEDPLLFYREIALNATQYLKDKGWLYFEIHEDLAAETIDVLAKSGFLNIELRKDLQGRDRMIKGQLLHSHHE